MKVAQLLEVLDETSMLELLKKVVERDGLRSHLSTIRNRPCLVVYGQFSTRQARIVLNKDKQLWKVTILTGQGHKVKEGEGDEAQVLELIKQLKYGGRKPVAEALDEEHMLRLMAKLLQTKGYPDAAMFKLKDRDPYIRVDINDTKIQVRYSDQDSSPWMLVFFSGVGTQVTREVYADEEAVLRELNHLSKKVTEAKVEDTLSHTFGRMLKKMAASDRGLWV